MKTILLILVTAVSVGAFPAFDDPCFVNVKIQGAGHWFTASELLRTAWLYIAKREPRYTYSEVTVWCNNKTEKEIATVFFDGGPRKASWIIKIDQQGGVASATNQVLAGSHTVR